MTHDYGLQRAERLLATHGQHGHRQLRLLECLVVLRVLRECGELRKTRSHSSGLRVVAVKKFHVASSGLPGSPVISWLPCCLAPYRNGVGILIHRPFEAL